jgi:hypothetical protein
MVKNVLENLYSLIWKEDDIIMGIFKADIVLDLEAARKTVNLRKTLTAEKDHLLLVDIRNIRNATREAREYMGSREAGEGVIKAAIMIDSNFSMILGNIFLKFNKPEVPTKLFTEKVAAVKWLKQPESNKPSSTKLLALLS